MTSQPLERYEIALQLRRILRTLRRQAPIIVLCGVIAAGVGFALAAAKQTEYQASAQVLIYAYAPDLELPNTPALFTDPTRARATALQLITSPEIADRVLRQLRLPSLSSDVSASAAGDSDTITVTVTDPSPVLAGRVANAFAAQFISFRRRLNTSRLLQAAGVIAANLAHPTQNVDPAQLRAQAARLRLRAATQTGDAQVVQPAGPGVPVNRHKVRDGVIGGAFGLLLGLGLAFLREQLNDRIDTEEELATVAPEISVIGYVPAGRGQRSTPAIAEAFNAIDAGLASIASQDGSRVVLVTSPMAQDGKSTTAINLALAMGNRQEQVLLVDADLRQGEGLSKAAMKGGQVSGVGTLLARPQGYAEAVQRLTCQPTRGNTGTPRVALSGDLAAIPSGGPASHPAGLFSQRSVDAFLAGVRSLSQNVVIDGPPLGLVADMLPVAKRADAVLVVVRLGHSRPRLLRRLLEQLQNAEVEPVGLVLVGAEAGEYY